MALSKSSISAILLVINIWLACLLELQAVESDIKEAETVKKELKVSQNGAIVPNEGSPIPDVTEKSQEVEQQENEQNEILISEKTLAEIQAAKANTETAEANKLPIDVETNIQMHVEESSYKQKIFEPDFEFVDSLKTPFYFFIALSCGAVLVLVARLYRMRLTRAERKYGVQGDRTTQELTPLPVSVEEGNSDDEDQTLFEINREHTRIL